MLSPAPGTVSGWCQAAMWWPVGYRKAPKRRKPDRLAMGRSPGRRSGRQVQLGKGIVEAVRIEGVAAHLLLGHGHGLEGSQIHHRQVLVDDLLEAEEQAAPARQVGLD